MTDINYLTDIIDGDKSGVTKLIKKYLNENDRLHRVGGPALILYQPENALAKEEYYNNGKLHRPDGPAVIHYNPDGAKEEMYFLNGKELSKEAFLATTAKEQPAATTFTGRVSKPFAIDKDVPGRP